MTRIVSVVGARPQFVKAAVVERDLRALGAEVCSIHTGQHYDRAMSGVFFEELGIPEPDVNLAVGSGTHAEQTARVLERIEPVLAEGRPDWVVVYGDTNSTLGAALAARKLKLAVAHVEAGLRSFDRDMPEEQNRVVTDHLADLLLAPSPAAVQNLAAEGLADRCVDVGDVMRDAHDLVATARDPSATAAAFGVTAGEFVLATVHRAENTDDPQRLQRIFAGLGRSPLPVLLPLHPRTRTRIGRDSVPSSVHVVEPVGFADMVALERASERVATDSGGVQKEALWSGVPCVTMRDRTEWTETVDAGWNTLVGADPDRIGAALAAARPAGPPPQLYGDGHTGRRIAERLTGGQQ